MDIDEYLKGILGQILDSYKILVELNDNPNDLDIIKKEIAKIRGLLQVINNKLNSKKYQSDHLVTLRKLSMYYIETYDYTSGSQSRTHYLDKKRPASVGLSVTSDRLISDRVIIIKAIDPKPSLFISRAMI